MSIWYKMLIILTLLAAQDAIVWHVKDRFDTAAQAEVLAAQIKATAEKQKAAEVAAAATEAELLTERQKSAMLAKRWSATRASKTHTDCNLDPDTLGVLRDAAAPANLPSR
jgi:hypothetical protein